jgi:catecholate siderophore receptor
VAKRRIKKKAKPRRFRGPQYWLAIGTLTAYSAVGGGKLALAQTSQKSKQQSIPDAIQAIPERRYNISAGPLGSAADNIEKVSGITISVADKALLGVQCSAVVGTYSLEQALKLLLADTGLDYSFATPNSVTISMKVPTISVDVSESVPVLPDSLVKYQQPQLEIPQTVNVVPNAVLEQQGTTTLRDALRNVAGISLAAGEGGAQGDNLTIRGFTARNDLFIDGMRDFGSYYRDPFNTEEVEVLQGPSSVTFGRGSTGGIVNQASKTPSLNEFLSVDLQFGTDATRRATVDTNVPLPKLGFGAAFRLNAMGDIGDVAGRDIAENRRLGIAPSLVLGLGTPTRLTFTYFHQNEDDIPDYGLPWLFNGPAPVDRSNYYGLKNANFLRTYDDMPIICATP